MVGSDETPRRPPGLGSGSRTPTGRSNTTRPPKTPRPTTKSSFKFRGGFRHGLTMFIITGRFAEFQSALRFAAVSDEDEDKLLKYHDLVSIRFKVRGGFRLYQVRFVWHDKPVSIRFEVRGGFRRTQQFRDRASNRRFQSALRFAVVPDPTPWHAVLTSPVVAVLHTTPLHPLQQADRTCPQWGKTPSQVPYTPEAVFGRSPTPLSEGVSNPPQQRTSGAAGFL